MGTEGVLLRILLLSRPVRMAMGCAMTGAADSRSGGDVGCFDISLRDDSFARLSQLREVKAVGSK